jgi:hypothetical protein
VTQQPFDLKMVVYDLQSDLFFFNQQNWSPEDFWKMLSQEKLPKLRNFSLEILSLFGSTYVCEAEFCTMSTMKSRMRNRLDNSSLESCLTLSLTGLPTDIDKLSAQNRLKHLTNYIGIIIIIVLVYWFQVVFKIKLLPFFCHFHYFCIFLAARHVRCILQIGLRVTKGWTTLS